jgi:hypothetical protein
MGHDAEPRHEECEINVARRACAQARRHLGWHDAFHHRAIDTALLEHLAIAQNPGDAAATAGPLPVILS